MNKTCRIIIIFIVVLLAGMLMYFVQLDEKTAGPKLSNFAYDGNVVKDNPGFTPGILYFFLRHQGRLRNRPNLCSKIRAHAKFKTKK